MVARRVAVLTFLALGAAACGASTGDDDHAAQPSTATAITTASSSSTATTAPVPPTAPPTTVTQQTAYPPSTLNPMQSFGDTFLTLQAANDAAITEAMTTYSQPDQFGSILWPDVPAHCGAVVIFTTAYRDGLVAVGWPAEAAEAATQLVNALDLRIAVNDDCSRKDGTFEALSRVLDGIGPTNEAVFLAEKGLRRALNLPIVAG